MFCPKCGNEVNEEVSFCPKCANDLKSNTSLQVTGNSDFGLLLLSIPVIATVLLLTLNSTSSLTSSLTTIISISVVLITLLIVIYEVSLNEPNEKMVWLKWVFYFVLFWIIGYPSYFADRSEYGFKKYTIAACLIVIGFVTTLLLVGTSFGYLMFNKDVDLIKNGVLQVCPDANVNQMVNSFLSNPKWEADQSEDGTRLVNITGQLNYENKPATAVVQFIVKKDNEFEMRTVEINGKPINILSASSLLDKMCEATQQPNSESQQPNSESHNNQQKEDVDLTDKNFWKSEEVPAAPAEASPAEAAPAEAAPASATTP